MKNLKALLLGLCVFFGAAEASAQECVPDCRRGFVCVNATCVSACNPACGNGESCVEGDCVPSQAAPPPVAAPVPAPAPQPHAPAGPAPQPYAPAGPAPQPYAPPPQEYAPPPAPPEEDRRSSGGKTPYLHDGMFLQFALGIGAVFGTGEPEDSDLEVDVGGVGMLGQFAIGGTLGRGLVLGGGVFGATVFTTKYEASFEGFNDSIEADGESSAVSLLGPFISYYPNPEKGFFLMAAPCFASVTSGEADDPLGFEEQTGTGFGLMAGLGIESFVGPQWSIGVMGRVLYVSAELEGDDSDDKTAFTGWVPGVMITATHH